MNEIPDNVSCACKGYSHSGLVLYGIKCTDILMTNCKSYLVFVSYVCRFTFKDFVDSLFT